MHTGKTMALGAHRARAVRVDNDPQRAAATEPAELQQFLLHLGSGLTAAGEAVNEIQAHLQAVAAAYGAPHARIVVLPTFVVVALDPLRPSTLELSEQLRGVLRLDQTSALFDIPGRRSSSAGSQGGCLTRSG